MRLKIERITDTPETLSCDLCLQRPAIYKVKQDNTRLCEVCLTKYLNEHGLKTVSDGDFMTRRFLYSKPRDNVAARGKPRSASPSDALSGIRGSQHVYRLYYPEIPDFWT